MTSSPADPRGRAEEALAQGRLRDALIESAASLRLDASDASRRGLHGEILRRLGAGRRSLDSFHRALELGAEAVVRRYPEAAWAWALEGRRLRLKGELLEADRALEKAVRIDGTLGAAWGWLGELRLSEGDALAAWRCLFEAELYLPDWAELCLWRGRTLAALGRHEEALRSYARAAGAGEFDAEAFELRSRSRSAAGDLEGARADLAAAQRRRAVREPLESLAAVERALQADPRDPALHAARAQQHVRLKKFDLARADLDRAVALDPSAASYVQRSLFLNDYGVPMEAVDDVTRALALRPSGELYLRRAVLFFGHRQFEHAFADFARAVAEAPDWPEAYEQRADALVSANRAQEALEDLAFARALDPENDRLRVKHAHALALCGRSGEALAALEGTEASVVRALAYGLARRFGEARAELDRLRRRPGASDRDLKQAALYGAAAAAAAAASRKRKKGAARKGRIFLCGLGIDPPLTVTVQTLETLAACDVVFRNASGAGIMDLLRILCDDCRLVQFRFEQDRDRTAETLLAEARKGRDVAFVTFGNPMVCGPLGDQVLKRAKQEGIECRVTGAVSSIDAMLSGGARELGPGGGTFQVLIPTGPALARVRINPAVPVLLYFPGASKEWDEFVPRLLAAYPPSFEGWLCDPHHEQWDARGRRLRLSEVRGLSPQIMQQTMLFIPPVPAARPAGAER